MKTKQAQCDLSFSQSAWCEARVWLGLWHPGPLTGGLGIGLLYFVNTAQHLEEYISGFEGGL